MPSSRIRRLQEQAKETESSLHHKSNAAQNQLRRVRGEYVASLVRQRAVAVAISNAILALVMLPPLLTDYNRVVSSSELFLFFSTTMGVVVLCVFVQLGFRTIGLALEQQLRGAPRVGGRGVAFEPRVAADNGREARREHGHWSWLFFGLILALVVNFFAVGRLVNATGGPTASPFAQFALTMFILGELMATRIATMIALAILGAWYFVLLSYTSLLGTPDPTVGRLVEHVPVWFVYAAVVNLSISVVVASAIKFRRRVVRRGVDL